MQNFIEVVLFKDQSVIDGIIHGTYHRSKAEDDCGVSVEEAKGNLLYYVDVTENAAKASIFSTLRRDPPFDIVPIGIFQTDHVIRGNTLVRPTFIFSDNLDVLDKEKFIRALSQMFKSVWNATNSSGTQIRYIASAQVSEKLIYCLKEALFSLHTNDIRNTRGLNYMPNVDDLEQNITYREFFDCFLEGNFIKGRVKELDHIVIEEDLCKLLSDEMITRVAGTLKVNKKHLYIPTARFRSYVMRNYISISEAIV